MGTYQEINRNRRRIRQAGNELPPVDPEFLRERKRRDEADALERKAAAQSLREGDRVRTADGKKGIVSFVFKGRGSVKVTFKAGSPRMYAASALTKIAPASG